MLMFNIVICDDALVITGDELFLRRGEIPGSDVLTDVLVVIGAELFPRREHWTEA